MTQLKTYSRKARLMGSSGGAYSSSQESFFDSPDDPYFFDSHYATGHVSQPSVDHRSTLASSSSEQSATAAFSGRSASTLPAATVVTNVAAALPNARLALPAKSAPSATPSVAKQAQPVSRLSQSSTVGAKPASALPAKQKRSLTAAAGAAAAVEGPAPKKARLKRSSSSSINQARNSGSSLGKDKAQQAPATTVLEVTATWVVPSLYSVNHQATLPILVCTGTRKWGTHTDCR